MKRHVNNDGRGDAQWDRVQWDRVVEWVWQARTELDRMLREASRRLATAPDTPFPARAVEHMVLAATRRDRDAGHPVPCLALQSFTVSSGTHESFGDGSWKGLGDQVCGIVMEGLQTPRELVTHITSDAVDTRSLGSLWSPWTGSGEGGFRSAPLIVDVWPRFAPLPNAYDTSQTLTHVIASRWGPTDMRDHVGIVTDRGQDGDVSRPRSWAAAAATLQWDVCLGTARSERLKEAVAQATSFDVPDWP